MTILSEILTSISILIAAATFFYTWLADRAQREREYADKIRMAASDTLSRVDRCQRIFLSLFQLAQPLITEIDVLFVRTRDVVACRDQLWQMLHRAHIAVLTKFDEEEVELSYAPLMGHQADIYDLFVKSIATAKSAYALAFRRLLEGSQNILVEADGAQDGASAILGNRIRAIAARFELELDMELQNAMAELSMLLKSIVQLSDSDIRERKLVARMIGARKPPPGKATQRELLDTISRLRQTELANIVSCKPQDTFLDELLGVRSKLFRDSAYWRKGESGDPP